MGSIERLLRRTGLASAAWLAAAGFVSLLVAPANAVPNTVFRGRILSQQTAGSGIPQNPPLGMWAGGLTVDTVASGANAITNAGGEHYFTSYTNPSPNTQLGVTFQHDVVDIDGFGGTMMAGAGLGAVLTAAYSPTGVNAFVPGFALTPKTGTIAVTPGLNTFGGTMKYLLLYHGLVHFTDGAGGFFAGTANVNHNIGTSLAPKKTLGGGTFMHNVAPITLNLVNENSNFGLTTGMIAFKDAALPVTVTVTGSDMRTPMGQFGTLQLISPGLISNRNLGPPASSTEHYDYTLTFLPEPGSTLALGAGLAALAALRATAGLRRSGC